jgi:LSD1 subclass zinc finger protein
MEGFPLSSAPPIEGRPRNRMALSPELLAILVCPACKGDLTYDSGASSLTCPACRLRYKVVEDIPVMLVDQAEKL